MMASHVTRAKPEWLRSLVTTKLHVSRGHIALKPGEDVKPVAGDSLAKLIVCHCRDFLHDLLHQSLRRVTVSVFNLYPVRKRPLPLRDQVFSIALGCRIMTQKEPTSLKQGSCTVSIGAAHTLHMDMEALTMCS